MEIDVPTKEFWYRLANLQPIGSELTLAQQSQLCSTGSIAYCATLPGATLPPFLVRMVQHCLPGASLLLSLVQMVQHCPSGAALPLSLWCRWRYCLSSAALPLSGAGRGTAWQGQGPRSDKMGVKPAERCSTTGFQISFAFNWPLAR